MQLKDSLNEHKCRMSVTSNYIIERVGVNKSMISRWMKGEARVARPTIIKEPSHLLGASVESLLKNSDRFEKPPPGITKVEYGLLVEENSVGYEEVSKGGYYRSDYLLRVYGDSMAGAHIHDQDLIYIKQCGDVKSGTTVAILTGNTEVTTRRIIKKEPFLILEAANLTVPICYFMQEGVRSLPVKIIGKVLYNRSDVA